MPSLAARKMAAGSISNEPARASDGRITIVMRKGRGGELLVESIANELSERAKVGRIPVYFVDQKGFVPMMVQSSAIKSNMPDIRAASKVLLFESSLLDKLDNAEIKAVVAHEVAHVKNKDLGVRLSQETECKIYSRVSLAGGFAMPAVGAAVVITLTRLIASAEATIGSPGAVALIIGNFAGTGIAGLILYEKATNAVAYAIRNFFERKSEFLADKVAGELTGNPGALASALQKMDGEHKTFMAWIYDDHPSIGRRVKRLLAQSDGMANNDNRISEKGA